MGKEFYFKLRAGGCCMYPQLDRPVRFSPDSADSVETAVLLLEAAADVPVEVTRSPLTDLVSSVPTETLGAPQNGNRSH